MVPEACLISQLAYNFRMRYSFPSQVAQVHWHGHIHSLQLPYTVRSRERLLRFLGIPRRREEHYVVGRVQVEAFPRSLHLQRKE
jgi:hypothetical protein